GQPLPMGRRLAQRIDRTAGVGFLNVSIASYTIPSIGHHVADMSEGHLPYLDRARAIAQVCERLPVLAACRVVDLDDAARALADGRLTAVAMTRAHIADPHLVRKAAEGRHEEIRPCVSCNFCIDEIARHRPITCMMNPTVGREEQWPVEPVRATRPREILVVGGGAAGLEAARVSAERGHRVRLWEERVQLGGQLIAGRRGAGRGELDRLRIYQEGRLKAAGVEIRLRHPATLEAVLALAPAPAAVVIATGARSGPRHLPGWGRTLTAAEALSPRLWTGRTIVIIDREGGWATASAAETLARGGGAVHLVTDATAVLWKVTEYSRMTAIERLRELGVAIWTSSVVDADERSLTIRSLLAPSRTTIPQVSEVVVIEPPAADDLLAEPLRNAGIEVHLIGDARAPRSLLEAMFEGHALGRAL
uniref:FAD-dependent oxidoreductase n=1 Tax=uncultured Aeromicrobium sp. TaxID=337820 RepID=UPI0025CC2202